MPKKLSAIQIKDIIESFMNGVTVDELSIKFKCTKITINHHLKNNIDEKIFHNLKKKNKQKKGIIENKEIKNMVESSSDEYLFEEKHNEIVSYDPPFVEIAPINFEIDDELQKDLSSVPLNEIELPDVVYMVVDKKIELEVKLLKDYPAWQFLSENELNRKTIEIFSELKAARRFCNKDQKVIKVPNTKVFKIAAPILLGKGISRIISSEKLIAL